MTSFWLNLDGGRREPPEQAERQSAATVAVIARHLADLRIGMRAIITLAAWSRFFATRAWRCGGCDGARFHAVCRRLAGAADRRHDGDLLRRPHAAVDAAGRAHAEQLVALSNGRGLQISEPDFQDFRAAETTFSEVAAVLSIRAAVAGGDEPRVVFGEAVSGD
jgi:hypothetical protein